MLQAPVLAMPMLVTGTLSAADGGAFYVAWTVVMVAVLLPYHFTTALYAASAADPRGLAAKLRFSLRISLLAGLAGVPLVIVSAHPLLRLFGAGYAARAAVPLELLIMGYFGSVLEESLRRAVPDLRADHASRDLRHRVDRRPARRRGRRGHRRRPSRPVNCVAARLLPPTGILVIPPVRAALNGRMSRPDRVQGPSRPSSTEGSPNARA